jgi:exodeoxyribonuclease VII large subunit
MARAPKSQWDFGGNELFSPAETRAVLSVTDLTSRVKRLVEKEFPTVYVRGEISNYRLQGSGHAYFVLKDAAAQLNCVLFRGQGGAGRASLRDGAQMILGGELTVYEPRGTYQLRVTSVEAEGLGALQAAFERLKQKLAAEGLFAAERKRSLPAYPRRIGIVTSPTGAALRDVLHVMERRFAGLEIVLAPSRVQGSGAAAEIVDAIQRLNRWHSEGQPLDVLLVTRGGGSLEDLWCFNEESVARAIVGSGVPVVSAVGHEIDFSIADFVADLRAATPSAAAEILTENYVASREFVTGAFARLQLLTRRRLLRSAEARQDLFRRLTRAHPRRRLEAHSQRLDDWILQLNRGVRRSLRRRETDFTGLHRALLAARPSFWMAQQRRRLEDLQRRLPELVRRRTREAGLLLAEYQTRLRLLSAESVLKRGYSITLDAETGVVIRNASDVRSGQRLKTRLAHGELTSVATRTQSEPKPAAE